MAAREMYALYQQSSSAYLPPNQLLVEPPPYHIAPDGTIDGLRRVVVYESLLTSFLDIAAANTWCAAPAVVLCRVPRRGAAEGWGR